MPIRGLTDQVVPRFPRLGKLRKGSPKPEQGNKPGADLDHFRFDGEPDVITAFAAAYGREPRVLSVYLPFAGVDDCFAAWKEKWAAGGLVHRCDGQTMQVWRTPDGKYSRQPKACDGGCDEVARLEVILPELFRAGHVGYVTLETHGLNDMLGIQATLNAAYTARRDLRGIEFVLRRVEREISTPGEGGKRVRRTKWIVELAPAPRWAQVQLAMAQSAAYALPEPAETIVDAATGEIVEPVQIAAPAPAPDPRPMPTTLAEAYKQGHQDGVKAPAPAKAPAATNGNGAAKREPTLADLETRWSKRWQQAKALGLTVEPIAGAATAEIYKERGKAIYAQILTAAKQRTAAAGDVNFDDTDEEIITKAVALANQEPANVTA